MHPIILRDPIHNDIIITNPIIMNLINTKEFQRLRRIKQLATASYTFPGAEHSRFSHSLGVYHLANQVSQHFEKYYASQWSSKDSQLAMIAALLHDIGHGAFSHTFEKLFHTNHEEITCEIILNKDTEINKVLRLISPNYPQKVADIISHKSSKHAIIDIISSQLDCDRMDYLSRDALFTGAMYGNIDSKQLIQSMMLIDGRVVFHYSGLDAVEAFIIGRHQMYQNVYFHPTNRAIEVILQKLLQRAKELYPSTKNYFKKTAKVLIPFFEKNYTLTDYLNLDDNILVACFSQWQTSNDNILSDLANRYINRKLLTSVLFTTKDEELKVIKDLINKKWDINYYTAIHKNYDLPYDITNEKIDDPRTEIKISTISGEILELSTVSPLVKSITSTKYGNKRFYFPSEMMKKSEKEFKKYIHEGIFKPKQKGQNK